MRRMLKGRQVRQGNRRRSHRKNVGNRHFSKQTKKAPCPSNSSSTDTKQIFIALKPHADGPTARGRHLSRGHRKSGLLPAHSPCCEGLLYFNAEAMIQSKKSFIRTSGLSLAKTTCESKILNRPLLSDFRGGCLL